MRGEKEEIGRDEPLGLSGEPNPARPATLWRLEEPLGLLGIEGRIGIGMALSS
jgi:hypothetical protein